MLHEPFDILALDSARFIDLCSGRGVDRAQALRLYRAMYREGASADGSMASIEPPPIVDAQRAGDTVKFILRHDDGLETESVIIPMHTRGGRLNHTLCVSSQVGCAMGCTFCETAQMGLMKNLSARDIVAQWYVAAHELGRGSIRDFGFAFVPACDGESRNSHPIRNIVFMGMGEPMDNLDAVLESIEIFADRNGPGIAPANIAVSTVGRAEGIRRYARFARREGFRKLKLAVSVNAPNDSVRSSIMPINRATPMAELMDAMLEWSERGTPVLIEYVLIPGVNDAVDHADELASYLAPLPCKVNVIPYNPRRDSPWPAPDESAIDRFYRRLRERGVLVLRRRTLGRDVMAACGQLGNPGIRRRRCVSQAGDNLPLPTSPTRVGLTLGR